MIDRWIFDLRVLSNTIICLCRSRLLLLDHTLQKYTLKAKALNKVAQLLAEHKNTVYLKF